MAEELSMAEQIAMSEQGEKFTPPAVNTESSLNIENNQSQPPAETTTTTSESAQQVGDQNSSTTTTTTDSGEKPPAQVTETVDEFSKRLAELSGGKFKDWKEVEPLLNPREEYDDEIKHLAELKKQGVKFDQEFWELQTKDYSQMSDPFEIIKESMKKDPEFKDLPDNVIEYMIEEKYKMRDWSQEEGEEPTEIETIQAELMKRDALKKRDWLIDYKKSRTLAKVPDADQVSKQAELDRTAQLNWEKFVDDELVAKVNKLSVVLDEKTGTSFSYEPSVADKQEVSKMMKLMSQDASVFWNMFSDGKGGLDQKQVYEAIMYLKNKNAIIKTVHDNAYNAGRESEVKTIKNIDFTPDGSKHSEKGETLAGNLLRSMGL